MAAIEQRAIAARVGLHRLCSLAGVSGTVATRWNQKGSAPSLPTIGKLERRLDELETAS